MLLSFGGFQVYYEEVLLKDHTASQISWISTFCAFALLAGGVVTGPMYDKGHFRALLSCGIVLEVLGLMMTSLSTEYYQLFLAQGLCIGIGGCLLYVPSIAAAASEFDGSTRPRVMGLIAAGAGIGMCKSRKNPILADSIFQAASFTPLSFGHCWTRSALAGLFASLDSSSSELMCFRAACCGVNPYKRAYGAGLSGPLCKNCASCPS